MRPLCKKSGQSKNAARENQPRRRRSRSASAPRRAPAGGKSGKAAPPAAGSAAPAPAGTPAHPYSRPRPARASLCARAALSVRGIPSCGQRGDGAKMRQKRAASHSDGLGGRLLSAAEESKRRFSAPARGAFVLFCRGAVAQLCPAPGMPPSGGGAAAEKDGLAVGFRMQRVRKGAAQATKACPPLSRLPSSARQSPASELLCAGTGAHSARISDAISRSISSTCGA